KSFGHGIISSRKWNVDWFRRSELATLSAEDAGHRRHIIALGLIALFRRPGPDTPAHVRQFVDVPYMSPSKTDAHVATGPTIPAPDHEAFGNSRELIS